MIGDWNNGTGRRKSSVARVFMKKGTGKITVNVRPATDWSRFGGDCAVVLDGTSTPLACDARNATLAFEAAQMLAGRLGTETGGGNAVSGAMGLVRLPGRGDQAMALRAALLAAGTDTPVSDIGGAPWLRISAQAYNEIADFERLAEILVRVVG